MSTGPQPSTALTKKLVSKLFKRHGETHGKVNCSLVQSQPDRESAAIENFDIRKEGSTALELVAEVYQAEGSATKVCVCVFCVFSFLIDLRYNAVHIR